MKEKIELQLEMEDIEFFHRFYDHLHDKKNIIYMYFTSGLLHYVWEATSFVPKNINLILIGAGLTDEEKLNVTKIGYPICFLDHQYRDGNIWEMLFCINQYNFGWLDIDCFVYDPTFFQTMVQIGDDIGINTLWAGKFRPYNLDYWFANTFFLFFNVDLIHKLQQKYGGISPKMAALPGVSIEYLDKKDYIELTDMDMELIRPIYHMNHVLNQKGYFDTTHLYQILLYIEKHRINRITNVDSESQYYFPGAIHLGGCNRIHTLHLNNPYTNRVFRFNMRFSYLLLLKYLPYLPENYKQLEKIFCKNLKLNKIDTDIGGIRKQAIDYLQYYQIDYKQFDFLDLIFKKEVE